jgi:hypothetical protein
LKPFELYVIPTAGGSYSLFSTPEAIHAMEEEYGDRVKQLIDWIRHRKNPVLAWMGRVFSMVHDYYVKLEDRIDPAERVLKAMASTNRFVVYGFAPQEFQRLVRSQRRKHIFWFTIDFMLSGVVLLFTPVLAPLPGPNVFFYYPFLRLLSHYRAVLGATSALDSKDIEFKSLPELRALEDNLPGLTRFLERMNS